MSDRPTAILHPPPADTAAIGRIVRLTHHRWAVPVLAELARTRGTRFVVLVNRLTISRDSLSRTLAALDALKLAGRNPGYGHPLRPEYVLTSAGGPVGAWAVKLVEAVRRDAVRDAAMKKWSCAALLALLPGARRFAELREQLPGITARALTLALKELDAVGLVRRRVVDDYPPRSEYGLAPRGRRIAQVCGAIPRYGGLAGASGSD